MLVLWNFLVMEKVFHHLQPFEEIVNVQVAIEVRYRVFDGNSMMKTIMKGRYWSIVHGYSIGKEFQLIIDVIFGKI